MPSQQTRTRSLKDMFMMRAQRTPSFPHLQMIPFISRGLMLPDLIAILGSIDFVMADVDR